MALRYTCLFALLLSMTFSVSGQSNSRPHDVERSLKDLADGGDTKAMLDLALGYLVGKYALEPNAEDAIYWLNRAAAQDKKSIRNKVKPNPRALLYLGFCNDDSIHAKFLEIKPNYEKALFYYELAEDHGFTEASQHIAFAYRKLGKREKSTAYFKKAADQNIARCQVEYAKILLAGKDAPQDPASALSYLEKASKKGSAEAMLFLADLYGGKYPQVKADEKKMIDALWQAASTESRAMTRIGYCYQHGIAFPKDSHLAIKWYLKAANAPVPDPIAMVSLGHCHSIGIGLPKSARTAFTYYIRAVEEPNAPAMASYNAGLCFLEGKGTRRDPLQGFNYVKTAAKMNFPRAITLLAELYEKGKAFDEKEGALSAMPQKALELYEKAAKANDLAATVRLGKAYMDGSLGTTDDVKALTNLHRAFRMGRGKSGEAWTLITELLKKKPELVPVFEKLDKSTFSKPAEKPAPVKKAAPAPVKKKGDDYPAKGLF